MSKKASFLETVIHKITVERKEERRRWKRRLLINKSPLYLSGKTKKPPHAVFKRARKLKLKRYYFSPQEKFKAGLTISFPLWGLEKGRLFRSFFIYANPLTFNIYYGNI